jgi:hypothetical protein
MKAFPHTYDQIIDGHVATCTNYGMDLRDWFDGLALQTFLDKYHSDTSVKKSYEVADEMMKVREQ